MAIRFWAGFGRYTCILLAVAFALIPIAWMTSIAFKPILEWNVGGGGFTWLPQTPTLGNFVALYYYDRPVTGPIVASLVTASLGTLLAGTVGTLAAYAVSRFNRMPWIGIWVLMLRLFPPLVIIVPVMVMWTYLDLIDTWFGLTLIYGVLHLPFAFWLMKTFFDEIPIEIEEAAMVEGCSHWRVLYRITLPLVRGPLATTGLFIFILCWTDYLIAQIVTSDKWVTVPVYMTSLTSYGGKAAMGLIATVPPIVLGLIIRRHLARGVTFGALRS